MVSYGSQSSWKPQLMFVFTWGVVNELHLLGTLNFRVVDYGILVWSLCDTLNYFFVLIVFVLPFNISTLQSLAFGVFFQWYVLEMLRFSDLYFQCSLSTICNINFVIWSCLHYFLFEMLHFSLDLIFSKHQATTLLLLVPLFLSFVMFFVLYHENILKHTCDAIPLGGLTCVGPNKIIFQRWNWNNIRINGK